MRSLVIAEHDAGQLKPATLTTMAAAQQLDAEIDILLAGSELTELAQTCAALPGVVKVRVVDAAAFMHQLVENVAPVLVQVAEDYTHIWAPATTFGKNLMPRAAALLDVSQISDITEVFSEDTFERPIYAGNALAKVQSHDRIKMITVRTTKFEPIAETGGSALIEAVDAADDSGLSSFVRQELTKSERPELTTAGIVISGGRGMQNGENFSMLESIASKLNAAVGASRAAVDAGYVPNDYQVGQTGKVVAPDLYIAVGISGAIQHLAGMKDSKVIVAINNDEEAPIFQVADYGLVEDLFKALPALDEELA